jgi:SDR family mycofactocin-dependent oxidoreductase
MGKFDGKVAFITGGARGQGRSHAVNLAREGADIVLFDLCEQIPSVEAPMSTPADMAETVQMVEAEGRKVLAIQGDVRDWEAVQDAVSRTVTDFGHLDLIVANAGIMPTTGAKAQGMDAWHAAIDTMLTGVFHTLKAGTAPMIEAGKGGSVVITGSTSSFRGVAYNLKMLNPGQIGYGAAKHGVLAIMENFAMALGPHYIRVNLVAPMGVRTPMIMNDHFQEIVDEAPPGWMANAMRIPVVEPQDITDAVVYLLSDQARYVTGTAIPVDSGQLLI